MEALSRRPPFPVSVRPRTLSVVAFAGHYNIGSNGAANHKGHLQKSSFSTAALARPAVGAKQRLSDAAIKMKIR